jgi:hypothetical protein
MRTADSLVVECVLPSRNATCWCSLSASDCTALSTHCLTLTQHQLLLCRYHYAKLGAAVADGGGHDGGHGRRQLGESSGKHARFNVLLHTGDAYYITKHDSMPLKLIPPYGHVDATDHHGIHTDACDVEDGEKVYIGLKGAQECADYEVTVEWFEGECHEMPFDDSSLTATAEAASGTIELDPHREFPLETTRVYVMRIHIWI